MGNTSERASADRHGAKAQRSDSSGSHKDQEPSSKMVDSTDDPNIFNTHGPETSKVMQERAYTKEKPRTNALWLNEPSHFSCYFNCNSFLSGIWRERIHPRYGGPGEDWPSGSTHCDQMGGWREGGVHRWFL